MRWPSTFISDNPLDKISREKLAEIYGENGTLDSWSQLGVEVPGCKDQEIVRVSRQNNSGTYVYFRDAVLGRKETTNWDPATCMAPKTS